MNQTEGYRCLNHVQALRMAAREKHWSTLVDRWCGFVWRKGWKVQTSLFSLQLCVKHFLWVCTFHIEMTFIEPVRYHVQAPRRLNILGHPQLGRRSTVGWVGPGRHCVWQETKDLKHLSQEPHCYFKAFLTQCRGVTGTAAVASMADAGSSEVQADGVHAHSAKID